MVLEAAALWSVVLGAAALWSAGAVVVAGAAVLEAAFWSAELVPVAGGFTGALALSPCAGA